jgi:hypothetical protein
VAFESIFMLFNNRFVDIEDSPVEDVPAAAAAAGLFGVWHLRGMSCYFIINL